MISYVCDASLAEITSYKIGGRAKYLFYPKDKNEIIKCLNFIEAQSLPFFVIGGGSNVLIGDLDFSGAVIFLKEINHITLIDDFTILVGAGALSSDVSYFAYENNLEGLEFLYKLPGSIGGAVVMNARAYGCEMSQYVSLVRCIDLNGKMKILLNEEMEFGYKNSIFQNEEFIIYEIELFLEKGIKQVIKSKMDFNANDRESKKQFLYPSAGCVFKNNYEANIHSGRLIDDLGFKGFGLGGALVSPYHANFIFNKNNAKALDVLSLIELIKKRVKEKKGIDLEAEIKLYGNFGNNLIYATNLSIKKN